MRVIGGRYRSRGLIAPAGTATRPTSDRLRETLFNIVAARFGGAGAAPLDGLRVADPYAGTGAVGIEAISRGAAHCRFGEIDPAALKSLRSNLAALAIPVSQWTIETGGAKEVLSRMGPVDLAFVDPPYEAADDYERTLGALGRGSLIAPGGLVVVEFATHAKVKPAERYSSLERFRIHKQGDSSLAFYELRTTPPV